MAFHANLEHLGQSRLDLHTSTRHDQDGNYPAVGGTRTPKVPRLPLAPSLSFVRVGATTGVPVAFPTPWGIGGVDIGVWVGTGVVMRSGWWWRGAGEVHAREKMC